MCKDGPVKVVIPERERERERQCTIGKQATVVIFTGAHARVVQAACVPKASSPMVRFTYRGSFFTDTGSATWDKSVGAKSCGG